MVHETKEKLLIFFSELLLIPNLLKFLIMVHYFVMATHFCDNNFPFICGMVFALIQVIQRIFYFLMYTNTYD